MLFINLYEKTGIIGLVIILLSIIALFALVRGVVFITLVKAQKNQDNSAIKQIEHDLSTLDDKDKLILINALLDKHLKVGFKAMQFLKLTAAVGPLLGLFGTVLGMVTVFSNLSIKTISDPSVLAGGIWQALLTTVMGLALAIPSLLAHYYLLINIKSLSNELLLKSKNL